ncbi:MAG: HU family DNA-binding protein [Acidobacteriota bacterium]
MNKGDLVAEVAKDAEITRAQAQAAVDSFLANVESALKAGDKVTLVGFGTFSVSERSARTGRNPQTGKPIQIAAKQVARFTPGKALKDAIN